MLRIVSRGLTAAFMLVCVLMSFPSFSFAAEDESVKDEIKALKDRIKALEDNRKSAETARPAPAEGEGMAGLLSNTKISLEATGVYQVTEGMGEKARSAGDSAYASFRARLGFENKIDDEGTAFVLFETGNGGGLDADVPTLTSFNAASTGDKDASMLEAWYEYNYGGKGRFKLGKVDTTRDFDTNAGANCERTQFLSPFFVNNITIDFPADTTPGMTLVWTPAEWFSLGAAAVDAGAGKNDVYKDGFYMLEMGLLPKSVMGQGNYRFYYWKNTSDHRDFGDPDNDKANGRGLGMSLDQELGPDILFFRYGVNNKKVYRVSKAWSLGWVHPMKNWGRDDDAFGFAYGTAYVSKYYKDFMGTVEDASGVREVGHKDETHFEFYYKYAVNKAFSVTPDLQYVKNAGGDKDKGKFWVYGLRGQLVF